MSEKSRAKQFHDYSSTFNAGQKAVEDTLISMTEATSIHVSRMLAGYGEEMSHTLAMMWSIYSLYNAALGQQDDYNKKFRTLRVSVREWQSENEWSLKTRNEGTGVPDELSDAIVELWQKLMNDLSFSGLYIAIQKRVNVEINKLNKITGRSKE